MGTLNRNKGYGDLNLATETDLANGSHGMIENIILDPREQLDRSTVDEHRVVWTKYPPAMILFKAFFYEFEPCPGLELGLIPIFPTQVKFNIHYGNNPKTQIHR